MKKEYAHFNDGYGIWHLVNALGCCYFPFKYKDIIYNECTMEGESKLWCATTVGDDGISYISGKYKYCDESCKKGESSG